MGMYQLKVLVVYCVTLILWPEIVHTEEGCSNTKIHLPPGEWEGALSKGYGRSSHARADFQNTLSTQFITEIDTKFRQCGGSQQCLVLQTNGQSDRYKICKVSATCLPHDASADADDVIPDAAGRRGYGTKPSTKSSECHDQSTGKEAQSCNGLAIGMLVLGMLLGSVTMAIVCVFLPSLHRKATHNLNKSAVKKRKSQWSRMPSTRSQTGQYVDAAISPSSQQRVTSPIEQPTYQEVDEDSVIVGYKGNAHMGYRGQVGDPDNGQTGIQANDQAEYQDIEPVGYQYNDKRVNTGNKQFELKDNVQTGHQNEGQGERGNHCKREAGNQNDERYDEGEGHVYSELGQRQQDVYSELGDDPRKIQNAELAHDTDQRDDRPAPNDATHDACNPDDSTQEAANYFVLEAGSALANDGRDGAGETGGTNILNAEQPHYFKLKY